MADVRAYRKVAGIYRGRAVGDRRTSKTYRDQKIEGQ